MVEGIGIARQLRNKMMNYELWPVSGGGGELYIVLVKGNRNCCSADWMFRKYKNGSQTSHSRPAVRKTGKVKSGNSEAYILKNPKNYPKLQAENSCRAALQFFKDLRSPSITHQQPHTKKYQS